MTTLPAKSGRFSNARAMNLTTDCLIVRSKMFLVRCFVAGFDIGGGFEVRKIEFENCS